MTYRTIVGVQILLIRDGAVLLARRRNTGFADAKWNAPGGKLEEGEDVVSAVIREAREEIGVHLRHDEVRMTSSIHIQAPKGQYRVLFIFSAESWTGDPHNREPDLCSELEWFPLEDLPGDTILSTRAGVELLQRGEHFGVYGWPDPALQAHDHRVNHVPAPVRG
ncbi:NUDIX domain-containing protein [Nocardia sp. NPDC049149]|uniref:NUDIX domain-containing protein n=1 Tax=Nocardia sp. NPDC049149 TaxID=3364315 RepID=UPI0037204651